MNEIKEKALAKLLEELKGEYGPAEDAILIGSYFVRHGQEFGELESHKIS